MKDKVAVITGGAGAAIGSDAISAVSEWAASPPWSLGLLGVPKLLVWGTAEPISMLPDATWEAVAAPRHRLVFADGELGTTSRRRRRSVERAPAPAVL